MMTISSGQIVTRWLTLAFLGSLPILCFAQADVDVGGSEEDGGYYGQPYPGQENDGQGGYGAQDQYGSQGQYGGQYGGQDSYGGAMDDGFPIVYAGDGMRVIIEQVSDAGDRASGTLSVGGQAPMRFDVRLQLGQYGEMSEGKVMTPSGPRPIRTFDQDEEVTLAEFEGRRYRLVFQENTYGNDVNRGGGRGQPPPPPIDYGKERRNEGPVRNNSPMPPPAPAPAPAPAPTPSPSPSPSPAVAGTVELVRHQLGGTHTVLAPKGWKVEGGAWSPPPAAFSWMPSRHITVSGPDGSTVIFQPNLAAYYQRVAMEPPAPVGSVHQAQGLPNMPLPGNLNEWGQWVEQYTIRPVHRDAANVRVSKARVVPELTDKLRRLYAPMSQFYASFDSHDAQMRADQQAISVETTFNANGSRWQQVDAFNHFSFVGQVASAFGGADYYVGWENRDAVSLRAPEGKLDAQMPVFLAIINSLRESPEYTRQILELQTKISKGNHEAAMKTINTYAEISRASYNANQEINAGIMKSYNERNASQDRGQRDFVNYIHDQQDYKDPSLNANVTLPSSYDRVFSNGKGDYVLTNDVSFEPGADWSSIQKAR